MITFDMGPFGLGSSFRPPHCRTRTWTVPGHSSEHRTMKAALFSASRCGTPSLKGKLGGGVQLYRAELYRQRQIAVPGDVTRRAVAPAESSAPRVTRYTVTCVCTLIVYFGCIFFYSKNIDICEKYAFVS